jgi:catalase (peroxidase I)
MEFRMGRADAQEEADVAPAGRLFDYKSNSDDISSKFQRMGFNKQETVALMG